MTAAAERTGLGVSLAAHVALFAALSLGFLAAPAPLVIPQAPVDVSIVDEVGLQATAPQRATEAPAPSVAPTVGRSESDVAPASAAAPAPAMKKPVPQEQPQRATEAPPRKADVPRGSRLGSDFLKGISDRPSTSTSQTPRAATVGASEMASLVSAIRRQVQPCADRINNPGPGANAISTKLNLRLNQDGSFAARPAVVSQSGINDDNGRYAKRVGELAASAFVQCAPFELPAELYEGWKNFNLNYKLPD